MSITPSGWYPDPGQSPDRPALERWWNGTTWTEYTRTAPQQAPGAGYGHPGPPQSGFPPAGPPPGGGRRSGVVVVAVAGALLLAAAVAGGVVLLNQDDGSPGQASPSASASGPASSGGAATPPSPGPTDGTRPPADPGGPVVDTNLGVSLPVPDGWQRQATEQGNAYVSISPYTCQEASSGTCVAAGVYTGGGSGTDAKAAAEGDIDDNAKASYGTVKGHRETKAGKVTVAGKPGYLVRWKVSTQDGPEGFVQSVAFPSPLNGRMVIVRFGFDDKPDAPKLTLMDEILRGIRAVTPANGV